MEDKKKGELLTVRSLGKTFFPKSGFKIWAICPLRAHKTPLIFKKWGMKNVPWYSEVPFIKCQIIIWFRLLINYMQPQLSVPSNPANLTLNPGCKVQHMLHKDKLESEDENNISGSPMSLICLKDVLISQKCHLKINFTQTLQTCKCSLFMGVLGVYALKLTRVLPVLVRVLYYFISTR